MTLDGILIAFVGVIGLLVGSFLNVVVWRVPRGESVIAPPSSCPQCAHRIRPRDNVPIFSWLLLRGRCRDCASPISPRYPLVELTTGVIFVMVALRFPGSMALALPAFLYLGALAVALTLIDIDVHRLPNAIVYPAYPVMLALLAVATVGTGDWFAMVRALAGGASMFLFYLILALAVRGGMGFGDVKLAGVLGLALGWIGWGSLAVGAVAAFVLGGLYSIALLVSRRAGRKSGIPFGPWMLMGAGVGVFVGESIADSYLGLVGLG